jgi:hypothetical protein
MQLLLCRKSPLKLPPTRTLLIRSVLLPVFVSMIGWKALWVPIVWVAKLRVGGDKLTPGCPYAGREDAAIVITRTNSSGRDVVRMNSSRRAFLGIGCSGTVRDTCIP